MVGNISNLCICEDDNEADLELRCEEVIEDASVAKSADKFVFQS